MSDAVELIEKSLTDIQAKQREAGERQSREIAQLAERLNQMETKANRPQGGGFTVANKATGLQEEAKALRQFFETGTGLERKDMLSQGTGAQGGYALPEQIASTVLDQLINVSPIRSIARVVQTETSDYKMLIGVRGATATWQGESGSRAGTNTPELGEVAPTSGELWAYPTISQWALADLIFDPEMWVQANITDAFAQAEGAAFVSGNGTDKPTGFLTGTPVSTADASRAFGVLQCVPTGASGAFATASGGTSPADVLLTLIYTLKAGYRPNARWVMNSATAATIRKFKDAEGRFIWTDGIAAGQPPALFGYPVVIAEDMPDIASNSFSVAFGDFERGYLITDRTGMRVIRDEVTSPGFLKLLVSKRVGGKILDSNAIKLLKFSAT